MMVWTIFFIGFLIFGWSLCLVTAGHKSVLRDFIRIMLCINFTAFFDHYRRTTKSSNKYLKILKRRNKAFYLGLFRSRCYFWDVGTYYEHPELCFTEFFKEMLSANECGVFFHGGFFFLPRKVCFEIGEDCRKLHLLPFPLSIGSRRSWTNQ